MQKIFKKYKIILGIITVCIIIVGLAYLKVSLKKSKVISENLAKESSVLKSNDTDKKEESKSSDNYFVDIKGAVNAPGVYEIEKDKRVIDVVTAAGGLRDDANTSLINLSKKVSDEMVIIIYTNIEVANAIVDKNIDKNNDALSNQYNCPSVKNEACNCTNKNTSSKTDDKNTSDKKTNEKININSATEEELMTISGIGEAKAKAIINYREENGNFNNIEDIMNVSGIGQSLYDKIKENITT